VTLVPDERLVSKAGEPVRLTPKAFDLLVVLATNPGRLVTKEQLMQAVWADTAVEESNLSYHVFSIRKALGDTAGNGHLIETVPKRGYRFTAVVQRVDGLKAADSIAPAVASTDVRRIYGLRRPWAAVGLACVLIGVWFLATSSLRTRGNPEPPRASPLTSMAGVVRAPSLSPDGNYVVFSWTGDTGENPDLYVQHIGSGEPLRLTTDPGNDYSPSWSPDGRSIAFLRGSVGGMSEIRLIAPLGRVERMIAEIQSGRPTYRPSTLSWCPDSTCLLVTDSLGVGKPDAVFAVAIESKDKRQITNPGQVGGDRDPVISPDGRSLVFRRDSTPFAGAFYRLALASGPVPDGEPVRLTSTLATGRPAWTPDSREIVFSSRGALWRLDAQRGGVPARLPFIGDDGHTPAISRTADGRERLVYVRSSADENIWRLDTPASGAPASAPPVVGIASTRLDAGGSLSPSGHRLTFTSNRTGEQEVWVADPDGSHAVQLTSLARLPGLPRWSPDGRLIAFHGDLHDRPDVVVIPSDGGQPRVLTTSLPNAGWPSFSRDGRWIYFTVVQGAQGRIWKMPVAGGDPVQVTKDPGTLAIESCDGRDLFYVEAGNRPSTLWRVRLTGGMAVKIADGVVFGNFDVVEGGIYYIDRVAGETGAFFTDRPGGNTRLRYFDFATGRSTTVAGNLGRVTFGLSASRDGRTVFFTRVDTAVDELMLVENFR
jgi:Tol biopolymer transport system component/DNA-binding winged helix-turn-helix (wHTH) protein